MTPGTTFRIALWRELHSRGPFAAVLLGLVVLGAALPERSREAWDLFVLVVALPATAAALALRLPASADPFWRGLGGSPTARALGTLLPQIAVLGALGALLALRLGATGIGLGRSMGTPLADAGFAFGVAGVWAWLAAGRALGSGLLAVAPLLAAVGGTFLLWPALGHDGRPRGAIAVGLCIGLQPWVGLAVAVWGERVGPWGGELRRWRGLGAAVLGAGLAPLLSACATLGLVVPGAGAYFSYGLAPDGLRLIHGEWGAVPFDSPIGVWTAEGGLSRKLPWGDGPGRHLRLGPADSASWQEPGGWLAARLASGRTVRCWAGGADAVHHGGQFDRSGRSAVFDVSSWTPLDGGPTAVAFAVDDGGCWPLGPGRAGLAGEGWVVVGADGLRRGRPGAWAGVRLPPEIDPLELVPIAGDLVVQQRAWHPPWQPGPGRSGHRPFRGLAPDSTLYRIGGQAPALTRVEHLGTAGRWVFPGGVCGLLERPPEAPADFGLLRVGRCWRDDGAPIELPSGQYLPAWGGLLVDLDGRTLRSPASGRTWAVPDDVRRACRGRVPSWGCEAALLGSGDVRVVDYLRVWDLGTSTTRRRYGPRDGRLLYATRALLSRLP